MRECPWVKQTFLLCAEVVTCEPCSEQVTAEGGLVRLEWGLEGMWERHASVRRERQPHGGVLQKVGLLCCCAVRWFVLSRRGRGPAPCSSPGLVNGSVYCGFGYVLC